MQNENQIQFNYTTKKITYNILSRLSIMKILFFIFLKIFGKYFLKRKNGSHQRWCEQRRPEYSCMAVRIISDVIRMQSWISDF